jgi:ribosome-associated protein
MVSRGNARTPAIPRAEIEIRTSRSGGPGGQHVNKTETKVEARWNVPASAAIDEATRERLLAALAPRLDADGTLRVTAQGSRSQSANREDALARLQALVARALAPRKKRKPSRPTAAAKAKRVEAKKRRSRIKQKRGRVREV